MAHEILIDNGKASMMYVGEEPWHGLGTRLATPVFDNIIFCIYPVLRALQGTIHGQLGPCGIRPCGALLLVQIQQTFAFYNISEKSVTILMTHP